MAEQFSDAEQLAIPTVLSTPRFNTFLIARDNDVLRALQLYHWNAQISAAFLFPLHVFEICIRNAVANAARQWTKTPFTRAFADGPATLVTTIFTCPEMFQYTYSPPVKLEIVRLSRTALVVPSRI